MPPRFPSPPPGRKTAVPTQATRSTAGPAVEEGGVLSGNRKLIRPSLSDRPATMGGERRARQRVVPPDQTGLEAAHYQKQANMGAMLIVTLENGTVERGVLEWHDRDALRIKRADGTGLVLMKHAIVHTTRDETAGS